MKKPCLPLLYQLLLLSLPLFFSPDAMALNLNWTGVEDDQWSNAANWDQNAVPGPADDVFIPGGTPNQPEVSGNQSARSVRIKPGGKLTIAIGASLTLDGAPASALINGGEVENRGTILAQNTGNTAIQNRNLFTSTGSVQVVNSGNAGIRNITAAADFNNGGTINLTGGIAGIGIENFGQANFDNLPNGVINIGNTGSHGILNKDQASFNNFGTINQSSGLGGTGLYNRNGSLFQNHPSGLLTIDGVNSHGLWNDGGGANFINEGRLGLLPGIGGVGLRNTGTAIFVNETCGQLLLDKTLRNTASWTNNGFLVISHIGTHTNTGTLINNGIISDLNNSLAGLPLTNNQMLVGTVALPTGGTIHPLFQGTPPFDLLVTNNRFYKDPLFLQEAAVFDPGDNSLTDVSGELPGQYTWFFEAQDPAADCASIMAVLVVLELANAIVCEEDVLLTNQDEVNAFGPCNVLNGNLTISGPDIVDLSNLNSLVTINGNLDLKDNDLLLNLNGLENLTFIGGNLSIGEHALLADIDGLSNLGTVFGITITDNLLLGNLNGLSALSGAGPVTVQNNPALTDIGGLGGVSLLGGLTLAALPALTSLDGLDGLVVCGGNLTLSGLSLLTNVDPLSSLINVTGNLEVSDNLLLSDCCGLFPLLAGGGVGGTVTIVNNPAFCSSQAEIIVACTPPLWEEAAERQPASGDPADRLLLFPNPARDHVQFALPIAEGPVEVRLTDALGRTHWPSFSESGNVVSLDLQGLPAGWYWLRAQAGTQGWQAALMVE